MNLEAGLKRQDLRTCYFFNLKIVTFIFFHNLICEPGRAWTGYLGSRFWALKIVTTFPETIKYWSIQITELFWKAFVCQITIRTLNSKNFTQISTIKPKHQLNLIQKPTSQIQEHFRNPQKKIYSNNSNWDQSGVVLNSDGWPFFTFAALRRPVTLRQSEHVSLTDVLDGREQTLKVEKRKNKQRECGQNGTIRH